MTGRYSFQRSVKLKSAKDFEALFQKMPVDNFINRHFLQVRYLLTPHNEYHFKVGFTVSKRLFKRAVHRNFLKRRLREAVRLNQALIPPCTGLHFVVVYRSKKLESFEHINETMKELLVSLSQKLNQNSPQP